MRELFEDRVSFQDFCAPWIYQSLAWEEERQGEWFRDAALAYAELSHDERWPLPHEKCIAEEFMCDGDWPGWPSQMMLKWMPSEIIEECGKVDSSRLNGGFLELRQDRMETVALRLRDRGFECRRNDELVALASGNGDPDHSDLDMRRIVESAEGGLKDDE